jgi:hypothetical protein
MAGMPADTANGGFTIPRWFLTVVAGLWAVFLAVFVPWASWMTYSVILMTAKIDDAQSLRARIEDVDKRTTANQFNLLDLQRRLDALEHKSKGGP